MDKLFADKAQKFALAIIFISFIGLITVPLFPWFSVENEVPTGDYYYECQDCGYSDEDYFWQCPSCGLYDVDFESETKTVTSYSSSNSGYIHIWAESTSVDEIEDLDGDISMIALCFWASLFLGVIALSGVALYRTGKGEAMAHILLLIAAIVIIFAILALVSHATFILHLGEYEDLLGDDATAMYGYNYFPLIMAILLLIFSIIYLVVVVPISGRALSRMGGVGYGAPAPYPQQYPQQYPPRYPPQSQYPPSQPAQYPPQQPQQQPVQQPQQPQQPMQQAQQPQQPRYPQQQQQQPAAQQPQQPQQQAQRLRACINCGQPIPINANTCQYCNHDQTQNIPPPP